VPREFVFDQAMNQARDGRMIQAADGFIQKTAYEQLLCDRRRLPAGAPPSNVHRNTDKRRARLDPYRRGPPA
jgi:hypothetical protein